MLSLIEELAFAKVNLSLHVLGRRQDGYHEINSIVAFADLADRLTLEIAAANRLTVSGPFAGVVPSGDENIIWKAWAVLNAVYPLPKVFVHLEKNIPVASGIGGGSADAAAMLRGLLRLVDKQLSPEQVINLAKSIGADVPVCFYGKPCQMLGIGETIRTLSIKLPPAIVLVNPKIACETSAVFAAMGLLPGQHYSRENGSSTLQASRNDMTKAAITVQPGIAEVLNALEKTPLQTIRMSGSGATCFGLADSFPKAEQAAEALKLFHPDWWIVPARLL